MTGKVKVKGKTYLKYVFAGPAIQVSKSTKPGNKVNIYFLFFVTISEHNINKYIQLVKPILTIKPKNGILE